MYVITAPACLLDQRLQRCVLYMAAWDVDQADASRIMALLGRMSHV